VLRLTRVRARLAHVLEHELRGRRRQRRTPSGTCYRARARSVLRRQRLRAVQRGPLDQPGGASM